MIIGLDFDGVITKYPNTFYELARNLQAQGDTVIVVTSRYNNRPNRNAVLAYLAKHDYEKVVKDVLFAGVTPKRECARKHGYEVDIWIDDNPVLVDFGLPGYDELKQRDPSAIKE